MRSLKNTFGLAMVAGTLITTTPVVCANGYGMAGMYPMYGGMLGMTPGYGMYPMAGGMGGMIGMMPMYGMIPMYGGMGGMYPMAGMVGMIGMVPMYGMIPMYGGMGGMYPMAGMGYATLNPYSMYLEGMDLVPTHIIGGMYPMAGVNYSPQLYSMFLASMLPGMSGMGMGMFPVITSMVTMYPAPVVNLQPWLYSMYGMQLLEAMNRTYALTGMYPTYADPNYLPSLYSMYVQTMLGRGMR